MANIGMAAAYREVMRQKDERDMAMEREAMFLHEAWNDARDSVRQQFLLDVVIELLEKAKSEHERSMAR